MWELQVTINACSLCVDQNGFVYYNELEVPVPVTNLCFSACLLGFSAHLLNYKHRPFLTLITSDDN